MSKNVIIISSSPRKGGNSDTRCDKFAQGAKDAGNNVEKYFLKIKKSTTAQAAVFVTQTITAVVLKKTI